MDLDPRQHSAVDHAGPSISAVASGIIKSPCIGCRYEERSKRREPCASCSDIKKLQNFSMAGR